jgi:hypothetical protein
MRQMEPYRVAEMSTSDWVTHDVAGLRLRLPPDFVSAEAESPDRAWRSPDGCAITMWFGPGDVTVFGFSDSNGDSMAVEEQNSYRLDLADGVATLTLYGLRSEVIAWAAVAEAPIDTDLSVVVVALAATSERRDEMIAAISTIAAREDS